MQIRHNLRKEKNIMKVIVFSVLLFFFLSSSKTFSQDLTIYDVEEQQELFSAVPIYPEQQLPAETTESSTQPITHAAYYCYTIDINNDFIVDDSDFDTTKDYNIDGSINEKDYDIFSYFLGCIYDKNINIQYGKINITKPTTLGEIYENVKKAKLLSITNTTWHHNIYKINLSSFMLQRQNLCDYYIISYLYFMPESDITINNCNMIFNLSAPNDVDGYGIYLYGKMNLKNSIVNSTTYHKYDFHVYPTASFTMDNSTIQSTGHISSLIGVPYWAGFTIATSDAKIINSTLISDNPLTIYNSRPYLDSITTYGYYSGMSFTYANTSVYNSNIVKIGKIYQNRTYYQPWYGITLKNSHIDFYSGSYDGIWKLAYARGSAFTFNRLVYYTLGVNPIEYKRYTYTLEPFTYDERFQPSGIKKNILKGFTFTQNGRTNYTYNISLSENGRLLFKNPLILDSDSSLFYNVPITAESNV